MNKNKTNNGLPRKYHYRIISLKLFKEEENSALKNHTECDHKLDNLGIPQSRILPMTFASMFCLTVSLTFEGASYVPDQKHLIVIQN